MSGDGCLGYDLPFKGNRHDGEFAAISGSSAPTGPICPRLQTQLGRDPDAWF